MRWEEFYEKSSEWAASTTGRRISRLESFGAPEEAEEYDEMSPGELEETCDYALECLEKAHDRALSAYNLSVADVASGKRALSVAKYACLAEATLFLAQAQLALEDLRPWIPEGIALDTAGLSPGKSAMRRDVLIDEDLSDLIIQKKIKKTLKSLESTSRKIQAFRSRLREKGGYVI